MNVPGAHLGGKKAPYLVAILVLVGVGIGAFIAGRVSTSNTASAPTTTTTTTVAATTTTVTTTTTVAQVQGPIGQASGDVEYICTNATSAGGSYTAAIAAVQDANGDWTCPMSEFAQSGTIEVGGSFSCVASVSLGNPDNVFATFGPYAASIGTFTVSGVAGTYYGAYCGAPSSAAYKSQVAGGGTLTTYSMTTT
jgi:hypothetical protein